MQKPAGKHRGKAAREIAFLSNRVNALEAELKQIREQKPKFVYAGTSPVYQLYCHKCGREMGLGNLIQSNDRTRTCGLCAAKLGV